MGPDPDRFARLIRTFNRPLVLLLFVAATLLALSAVVAAESASAARYTVAQCGWHVGQDAGWLETSADKFSSSSYCQTPAGADPFENVHLSSSTRGSTSSVSGTRFARWRWSAPPGTGIVTVHGQRWQVLGDNFEHRLGGVVRGGFEPFLQLASTDTVRRDFSQAFSPFADAFESRLLCAMPEERFCAPANQRMAGVRALTITLDDSSSPQAWRSGPAAGSGWMRGVQALSFGAGDSGSGIRYSRTLIDGATGPQTEHPCSKELIAGQWRAVKMLPCALSVQGVHQIDTTRLSDGPHWLRQCSVDFAGNTGCAADSTLRSDNNPPAAPRSLVVAGGEGWHRTNGFRIAWTDPDQGVAAPIIASQYRVTGDGFDSGVVGGVTPGLIDGALVPRSGEFRVTVWLIDAAGNTTESNSAAATLRLDSVPPSGYLIDPDAERPEIIRAGVSDGHSGVASGRISVRRIGGGDWIDLPTQAGAAGEVWARFPSDELDAGRYSVRLRVTDVAGNEFETDRRGNGSPMELRAPLTTDVRLGSHLESGNSRGLSLTVGFDARAEVKGHLTDEDGRALGGQMLEVTESPAAGASSGVKVRSVLTGPHGYFELPLAQGPSRQVRVSFPRTDRYSGAEVGPLELKVRGFMSFDASPRRLRTDGRLRFRGRVATRSVRMPSRSTLVAVQYFEKATRRWRPVLVTRANRFGDFRASYRFRYLTGPARIRLRARLLPPARFPYSGAVSRPVVVRVGR